MSSDIRWSAVDAIGRPTNLRPSDRCLYLHVYTPQAGYGHSRANQLVFNYKKPVASLSDVRQARYKDAAIREYADAIMSLMRRMTSRVDGRRMSERGHAVALVPVPPSAPRGSAGYDDRNGRVCRIVCDVLGFAMCDDIEVTTAMTPSHGGGSRDPEHISSSYARRSDACNDADTVFLVDDTLVSGAHFVACKTFLEDTGCEASIYGLFLARSMRA